MAADDSYSPYNREFKFRQVTILKETLGRGAYGVVHKAKCDELICAAKYMHPTFFVENEGQHFNNTVANQFRKECDLLSHLKHPNIVQFLGTHEEPGINTVIILMEKLDTSLYAYIQAHKTNPLPFYQEVNISRDVACALDYLHVNGIHHRDLSCKNILMLKDLRAKVSDFGQSKLRDPKSGYSNNTPCPGNILYMPPETLKIPPTFAKTLDEFSLGVVMIQIMNRQDDPQPTDLQRPGSSPGMFYDVDENERRRKDIELCDPANPILTLALECIANNPKERPLVEKICKILSLLQTTSQYKNSVNGLTDEQIKQKENKESNINDFVLLDLKPDDTYYTKKISFLERENEDKEKLLKGKTELLEIRNRQLLQKCQEIENYESRIAEKDNILKEKDNHFHEIERQHTEEIEHKNTQIVVKEQQLSEMRELLSQKEIAFLQKEEELAELKEQLQKKEQLIVTQREQQTSSDERYSKLVDELELVRNELASVANVPSWLPSEAPLHSQAYGRSSSLITNGTHKPSLSASNVIQQPIRHEQSQTTNNGHTSNTPNNTYRHSQSSRETTYNSRPSTHNNLHQSQVNPEREMELKWDTKKHTPVSFQPQSSIAVGHRDRVYVTHCNYNRSEGKIYEYNLTVDKWKLLPLVNKSEFSIAIVNNHVVAIGGSANLRKTGSILYLSESGQWKSEFLEVPSPRSFPTCVVVDNRYLIVVGGEINGEPVSVVEILDIERNRWRFVPSLPVRNISRMMASVKGSLVYLMGGFEDGVLSNRVFTVDAYSLVSDVEVRRTGSRLWRELPFLPVSGATTVSFQDRILALGGYNNNTKSNSFFIYEFNPIQNSWKGVGFLPRSFSRGLVVPARLDAKEVLVIIGGNQKDGVSTVTNVANVVF